MIVYVTNQSNYPNDKLQTMINAVNVQLTKDVEPVWGIQAQLTLNTAPPEGSRKVTFLQDFSSLPRAWHLCTGYHTTNSLAYIDVNECENDVVVSVTLSHEALEMLSNPDGISTGHEICDPVLSRYYGYVTSEVPDVIVSDFVYPSFYVSGSQGPWDKTGQVKESLHPAPGGQIFSSIGGNRKRNH